MITLVRDGRVIVRIILSNNESIYCGDIRFNLWLKRIKNGKVIRRYADSLYNYVVIKTRK